MRDESATEQVTQQAEGVWAGMDKKKADEKLRDECLKYFKEHLVFARLLKGFREKYFSYGRFAGTVTVRNLTETEREDLEGFLLRNYHGKKSATVSATRFEAALAESRFAGISGKEVLELYFQETPEGRKEQKRREDSRWTSLLDRAKEGAGPLAVRWIDEIGEAGILTYLKKRCREAGKSFDEAERLVMLGVRILDALSMDKEADRSDGYGGGGKSDATASSKPARYLAVFAAEVTGNPHAFDAGTKDGKYLEMLVEWYVRKKESADHSGEEENRYGFPAFRKQRLYLKAGILRDDVSNYALAAGIRAVGIDGESHRGMEGFFEEREPVQIPLSAIAGWKSADCPGKRIYIVENPSVYAVLCGKWNRKCGLMCMNGQPRFSSLLLLDLLAKSGTEVWYAGDIDPEGLLIAQRLKQHYQGAFYYWHMSSHDYEMCVSEQKISPRRLRMLESVMDPELKGTAEAVKRTGKAGYQENMVGVYMEIFQRDKGREMGRGQNGE